MSCIHLLSTLLLAMIIVLCGGIMLRVCVLAPFGASRVEEIRRLRQAGLEVNQEEEA